MELMIIFYAALIVIMIKNSISERATVARSAEKKAASIESDVPRDAMLAHLNGDNRIRGDFVLTGAALPIGDNAVTPVEGYRVEDVNKDGSVYFVVAAVSAEKIWSLIRTMIDMLGDYAQVAILHWLSEEEKAIDYIADKMDRYHLISILESHRAMIVNDGAIETSLFSEQCAIELRIDACKHFQFLTRDLVSVVDLLHDFDIHAIDNIRFFPEGPHLMISPEGSDDELKALLEKLTIIHTNYVDKPTRS